MNGRDTQHRTRSSYFFDLPISLASQLLFLPCVRKPVGKGMVPVLSRRGVPIDVRCPYVMETEWQAILTLSLVVDLPLRDPQQQGGGRNWNFNDTDLCITVTLQRESVKKPNPIFISTLSLFFLCIIHSLGLSLVNPGYSPEPSSSVPTVLFLPCQVACLLLPTQVPAWMHSLT